MSDNFRQAVEKIFKATHDDTERIELILSAHNAELDRIAESLPPCKIFTSSDILPLAAQRASDRAYIQAQKGS
jgi:hypothetical protein